MTSAPVCFAAATETLTCRTPNCSDQNSVPQRLQARALRTSYANRGSGAAPDWFEGPDLSSGSSGKPQSFRFCSRSQIWRFSDGRDAL